MTKPTVYLAGPIADCTEGEANDWRVFMHRHLVGEGIIGVSPLRCEPLEEGKLRYSVGNNDPKFGAANAIAAKNMFDVLHCDMTLCYFPLMPNGRHASYGTLCELAWAKMAHKPTILVSTDPKVLEHPVILSNAGWVLNSLDDALDVIVGILGAYAGGKNV